MADFDLLNPEVSRVTKSLDGLVMCVYGKNGVGKTPQATRLTDGKVLYIATSRSGLQGLNGVSFFTVNSWSDFVRLNKEICNKKRFDEYHAKYSTIVLDEIEVLWKFLSEYVCQINGITRIKEGDYGSAYQDLKDLWEKEMIRLMNSGFCIQFILHAAPDDSGKMYPVGDFKRMLPIILNHSEIIGYVKSNGIDPETGKTIHSSLCLADTDEYFARTRNDYFQPIVEDYTAENLTQAYYDALDRQAKAEGVKPATKAETDKVYAKTEIDFDVLMDEVQEYGAKLAEEKGMEVLIDIVEAVLGKGAKVSQATKKQTDAVLLILGDIKDALNE